MSSVLNAALFKPSQRHENGVSTLTLEYQDASGIHARKLFSLGSSPFVLSFSVLAEQAGRALNPGINLGPALGSGRNLSGNRAYTLPRASFPQQQGDA
jgi:hypothetical protein